MWSDTQSSRNSRKRSRCSPFGLCTETSTRFADARHLRGNRVRAAESLRGRLYPQTICTRLQSAQKRGLRPCRDLNRAETDNTPRLRDSTSRFKAQENFALADFASIGLQFGYVNQVLGGKLCLQTGMPSTTSGYSRLWSLQGVISLDRIPCYLTLRLTLSIKSHRLLGKDFDWRVKRHSAIRKERTVDIETILSELREERDRINAAIVALQVGAVSPAEKRGGGSAKGSGRRRGGITPEGRRRLSLAMKKRWAERRKKRS